MVAISSKKKKDSKYIRRQIEGLACGFTGAYPASRDPRYRAWALTRRRCTVATDSHCWRYGGAGITMCAAWRNSFEQFCRDMGPKRTKKHELRRRDKSKWFTPKNAFWDLRKRRQRKRTDSTMLTFRKQTKKL